MERDDSLHRSQFVLGPDFSPQPDTWQRLELALRLRLTVHPALSVRRRSRGNRSLALLGYALDPYHPERDDDAILGQLLEAWSAGSDLYEATSPLGGRWVLVAVDAERAFLFHDASGLRQVVHTTSASDTAAIWCASHPALLGDATGLGIDPEAEEFARSPAFQQMRGGAWWPGTRTIRSTVERLLPNHRLDLLTGRVERCWPLGPLGRRRLEDAVEEGTMLLRGVVLAAAARFDLELMITAGWDSRMLLAACRPLADRITYLSIASPDRDDLDTRIPAQLLRRLGLAERHAVVRADSDPSEPFWNDYSRNVPDARRLYAANAEILLDRTRRMRVAITGHAAGIVKGFYRARPHLASRLPPAALAQLVGLGGCAFAEKAFADWRSSIAEHWDVPLLNLFYWEQRGGSWLPSWLLEYDWSWRDVLVPMNCRRFLEVSLSVPERERCPPVVELWRRVMLASWPEVLEVQVGRISVPARPARPYERWLRDARSVLTRLRAGG